MDTYLVELTGKQISMLCACIDERITNNNTIQSYTNQNMYSKNRSLRSLQKHLLYYKNGGELERD